MRNVSHRWGRNANQTGLVEVAHGTGKHIYDVDMFEHGSHIMKVRQPNVLLTDICYQALMAVESKMLNLFTGMVVCPALLHPHLVPHENLYLPIVSHNLHFRVDTKGILCGAVHCYGFKSLGYRSSIHTLHPSEGYLGLHNQANILPTSECLVGQHRVRAMLICSSSVELCHADNRETAWSLQLTL